jgi:hypothetical protein
LERSVSAYPDTKRRSHPNMLLVLTTGYSG